MSEDLIEQLLDKEYIVVDFLPEQVSADSKGRFFSVEHLFLQEPRISALRSIFSNIILKLYCYYEIQVFDPTADKCSGNPEPVLLDEWIRSNQCDLQILLEHTSENALEDTLIVIAMDDTHMTVYNPSDRIIKLLHTLAAAEGLFVWNPQSH